MNFIHTCKLEAFAVAKAVDCSPLLHLTKQMHQNKYKDRKPKEMSKIKDAERFQLLTKKSESSHKDKFQ